MFLKETGLQFSFLRNEEREKEREKTKKEDKNKI
jgi:hypothetical protein